MKKLLLTSFLIAAFSVAVGAQIRDESVMAKPFKTDNCTFFPDGNYAACCVAHDRDYYFGGTNAERKASDKRLRDCVRSKGKGWKRKLLANMMFFGVRIGGVHWLPTPFRWGFGNKWPRKSPPEKPKDDTVQD